MSDLPEAGTVGLLQATSAAELSDTFLEPGLSGSTYPDHHPVMTEAAAVPAPDPVEKVIEHGNLSWLRSEVPGLSRDGHELWAVLG